MQKPNFQNFENHFNAGKSQLLQQWVPADLETPLSAYIKLSQDEEYSLLLESVEGGAVLGRYSAIGLKPDLIWSCERKDVDGEKTINHIKAMAKDSRIDALPKDTPPMASSGLFGFMGYDMIRLIEEIPDNNPDDIGLPECVFVRPTIMVIFDNVRQMMCISTPVREHKNNSKKSAKDTFDNALNMLNEALENLNRSMPEQNIKTDLKTPLDVKSNMSEKSFHAMIKKAVEYIYAGDIFQTVLSQRFSMKFDLPSIYLYRSLRRMNPSPFLFHLQFGDFSLVGSSPEILVRVRNNRITIRPIAGTRPRGKTPAEDKSLADDLLQDEKECAEHLMLLDLGRNDVGRVAEIGSVKVTEKFTIELYSHVMHIVSNVEGMLAKGKDTLDALFAGFPAGTVSGAPKIRAMEIIDELEPVRRSFYAGCVGYLDGHGDVDTCITLRTALIKDQTLYVQAGGGVVADSTAEGEFLESQNKARAIIAAAEDAIQRAA